MTRSTLILAALVQTAALAGCHQAGQLPEVVDAREVSTSRGSPEIASIVDLGAGMVPRAPKAAERMGRSTWPGRPWLAKLLVFSTNWDAPEGIAVI